MFCVGGSWEHVRLGERKCGFFGMPAAARQPKPQLVVSQKTGTDNARGPGTTTSSTRHRR
jgi:hypothetical protein